MYWYRQINTGTINGMVQATRLQHDDFLRLYPVPNGHEDTLPFPQSGTIGNWSQIARIIPSKIPKVKGKIKPVLLLLHFIRRSVLLLHTHGGHIKNQCCIGRNTLVTLRTIGQRSGKNDSTDTASLHPNQSLVPTLNDTCLAKWADGKGLSAMIIGAIKLFAIACQPARVLNGDRTPLLCYLATANFKVKALQSISVCSRGSCHGRRILRACLRSCIIDRRGRSCCSTFRANLCSRRMRCLCCCAFSTLLSCITLILPESQAR